jgi:acetolactate synthase-1/2/3 large subunit
MTATFPGVASNIGCHRNEIDLGTRGLGEQMSMKQRVVDDIVGYLAAIGVDYIFGVDGANIEDLYDAAFFQSDITAVLAKHEFSAATMADGYSRSSGDFGVVAVTSGGGALNPVAGLGESFTSRVPVLALVGQPATTMDGRGSFQDTSGRNGALNAEALFSEVSLFCRRVQTPADIASALPAAVAAARTGGPAVLLLPKDVQQSNVRINGFMAEHGVDRPRRIGDPRPIVRALRRVTGRVTIIAGEQVARDDARAELASLRAALDVDGPSVVSIECAADEIPPFATFLGPSIAKNIVHQDITKDNRTGRCTRATKSSATTARSMPTPA